MCNLQGTKIFLNCTRPAGRVHLNVHSSCKHMHSFFKYVWNKDCKGLIWLKKFPTCISLLKCCLLSYSCQLIKKEMLSSEISYLWGTQNKQMKTAVLLFLMLAWFLFRTFEHQPPPIPLKNAQMSDIFRTKFRLVINCTLQLNNSLKINTYSECSWMVPCQHWHQHLHVLGT